MKNKKIILGLMAVISPSMMFAAGGGLIPSQGLFAMVVVMLLFMLYAFRRYNQARWPAPQEYHLPKGLEHELPYPKENDYHGHPNYTIILVVLMILLGVSLLSDFISSKLVVILLVFGTALVKASLVVGRFMHWKFENKVLWIMTIGGVLFILFSFFFLLMPDFTSGKFELAPR